MYIKAAEFKAKCLGLMDQVNEYKEEVIITKYGKEVAKLVPCSDNKAKSLYGYLKGTVLEIDDITKAIDVEWDADLD